MSKRQFKLCCSPRGAPMGRASFGTPENAGSKIRLFRLDMSEGYDDGGAYWGTPNDVFCARDTTGDYRQFVRANSREDAREMLGIPMEKLARPTVGR